MKTYQQILIFTFLFLIIVTCDSNITGTGDGPVGELPRELSSSETLLVEADQSFSYEIFRETVAYDQDEENIFVSPISISMALAMTLNGAKGQTFDEMRETLHLSGMELEEINSAFQSLIELMVTADPKVTLKIANSIWYREGLPVDEGFQQRMRDFFDARIEGLDFNDPASVAIINSWVSTNTEGLIEAMIDRIPANMVLYLMNALYFKADWMQQFDPDDTRKVDFNLESGGTQQIDMMHQEGKFARYLSNEVEMIELPYGDSLFSMSVIMPGNANMPIDQFVDEKINAENLAEWRSNLTVESKNILQFPKFELKYDIQYNDILKAMGMEAAFDAQRADLTGIAPMALNISEVKHKTFIKVDEKGTEAAAVTSVGVEDSAARPFIVNRPFVFIIHERESGLNLFIGKVKNPVS